MTEKPQEGCGCMTVGGPPIHRANCDYPRVVGELGEAVGLVKELVGSGFPNKKEHPIMYAAWTKALAFLEAREAFLAAQGRKES